MATFEEQIEGLTSLTVSSSGTAPTQAELTQFLTDGAKEIINIMPSNLLPLCSSQATFTSTAVGSEAETLNTSKILNVFRNDGDIDQPCRVIDATIKGRVSDPYEMQYATVTDPVYYIENNKINALPDGGSCKYSEVQYPSVAYGDSAISVFPDEAEYLVPLYAAIKSLQNVLGDKSSNSDITTALTAINAELDECLTIADNVHTEIAIINSSADSALTEIGLANAEVDKMATEVGLDNAELDLAKAEIAEAATLVDSGIDTAVSAIATAAGRINTAVLLANDEFDEIATQVTGSVTSAIASARAAVPSVISVSDLSISTTAPVSPSSPSFNAGAISVSSSAPTYVKPVFSAPTLATVGSLTLPVAPSVPSISAKSVTITGTAPAYIGPSYTTINTYIDTNEDIELGQAKLQEINSQIQDGLNKFNDDNVEYQAKLQKDIQDAQLSDTHEARKLQKYQAEVSQYQAESNSKLQEWINEEWNQNFQKYQQDYSSKLQTYGSDIQNELNEFNKEQTVFQNELQEKIQEANNQQTKDSAEYGAKLQKYSNELQAYQAQVNDEVQEYQANLQQKKTEFDSSIALQASYYQESQAGINAGNAYLAEANASAQEAQTYANEVSARVQQVQAQIGVAQGYIANGAGYSRVADGYAKTAQGFIGTAGSYLQAAQGYAAVAQAYANEIQSKVAIAQAYGNEVQSRLSVDNAHYGWYEKQQVKLQQDYDKGLQFLTAGRQSRGER